MRVRSRDFPNKTTAIVLRGLALLILIALLSVACGQKGDLILPDDAKAQQEKKKKSRLF